MSTLDRGAGTCQIRACTADDVAVLERVAPTGRNQWHARKFERQQAGAGTYLIAWTETGEPVAHCEVRWDGCASPTVQAAYPECPEINGLRVYRDELRGRGIGSALIRTAESLAHARAYEWIGLGVADDNPRAARLYARLGYVARRRYVDVWTFVDDNGTPHTYRHPCTFLVKELPT
jgi:GNAT superfamily N-acetyltransferase